MPFEAQREQQKKKNKTPFFPLFYFDKQGETVVLKKKKVKCYTHTHTHTRMHVKIKDGCLEKDGPALRLADSTRRYPQASAVKGDRVRRDQRGSTPLPPKKKKRHSFFFTVVFQR